MSTADFRHIAFGGGPRNCERLFRAAISAFCTLSHPTKRELAQLDDLALGLFDAVPAEARRFAAAALSECDPAPRDLVRRLAEEPVETSAPLLVRSNALSDVDLIALIGRHGLPHAKAIARRNGLNPVIAALIRALVARAESEAEIAERAEPEVDALETIRCQLRDLMQEIPPEDDEAGDGRPAADPDQAYTSLREAALSDDRQVFATTLARSLDVSIERTRRLTSGIGYADLFTGLRALELTVEQAFLVTAAIFPAQVAHAAAIRLFIERYTTTSTEAARKKVEGWRCKDRLEDRQPAVQAHSVATAR
ncbi:hypothetical protein [Chelativorans salis]|uniref:DUF2336 domain-containing protein n=1 Tax=Chelativorans salis TaxID=2978478 RepID=A0ABT2LG57_9HYPH|nr:hypothetical protein [Chelativorans sp. EGI FJ00035]MCT7373445.1 hypothetical protein [Chelativorans sp. EGI FJ00035]